MLGGYGGGDVEQKAVGGSGTALSRRSGSLTAVASRQVLLRVRRGGRGDEAV